MASLALVWLGSVTTVSVPGAPSETVIAEEVALVKPETEKPRVLGPVVPPMARFVKVAVPLASVLIVAAPSSAGLPVAIAAETARPACRTLLPYWSSTRTTGCWTNAWPACAVPEGWVVMESAAAGAGVTAIVASAKSPVSPVSPDVRLAVSTWLPAPTLVLR